MTVVRIELGEKARAVIYGAAAKGFEERLRKDAVIIVKQHYDNAVTQIGQVLDGVGTPSTITTGGGKIVAFKHADGKAGRVTTEYWDPLTPKHIARKEPSTVFWHKNGVLAREYRSKILPRAPKVTATSTSSVQGGKLKVLIKMTVGALRAPFSELITESLVHGEEARAADVAGVKRNSVERAIFLEQGNGRRHRPFIARMSAALGVRMRSALQKLK